MLEFKEGGITMKNVFPDWVYKKYEIHNFRHAITILQSDFPDEYNDVLDLLEYFYLLASDIVAKGGRKSPISNKLDQFLYDRGWEEKSFSISKLVDDKVYETPSHKIDCFKNKIGLEIEWNNKDPFYDRDLNNFRLLHTFEAISLGIIITRSDELQELFNILGKKLSYGSSTTTMKKLLPRIAGNAGGGCPLIVIGIDKNTYKNDLS